MNQKIYLVRRFTCLNYFSGVPVGLFCSKILFKSLRLVTVLENWYQTANEHFKQMFILNKKSHLWRLITRAMKYQIINQYREKSLRKLVE